MSGALFAEGRLAVLLGNEDATFGEPRVYEVGLGLWEVVAVDLDGAGGTDLVVGLTESDRVVVLLSRGDFAPAPLLRTLVLTGCTACQPGDTVSAMATFVNKTSEDPLVVELRAGLRGPDGEPLARPSTKRRLRLPRGETTLQVFRAKLKGGWRHGRWQAEAAILEPVLGETWGRRTALFDLSSVIANLEH
jgi:hypothetical protein